MKNTILVILLLGIFALLAITSIAGKSGTCDEIAGGLDNGWQYLRDSNID